MDLSTFKMEMDYLCSQIEDLINEMPYKGNKEEDSQKVCLQNALNKLQQAVNGCEEEDFEA